MVSAPPGALHGVRVLDLTQALAGPFCTQMLADQGADVIKLEAPGGDMLRRAGPFAGDDQMRAFGSVFQSANRNKRSIVLDLKAPEAREPFLRLVDQADILVENFRAGVMERLGYSYESLALRNPRLVYTSVRGFGDRRGGASPYVDWPAFDIVAQAMGGIMAITGPDPDTPCRVGTGLGDTAAGLFAAFATLAALWEAKRSGQGQYVDVAMVDCVLALSEAAINPYSYAGQITRPMGNRMAGFAPFGTVRCRDGLVAIAAPHRPQWEALCRIMERPELIDDPRFATDAARFEHREAAYAAVEDFARQHDKAALRDLLGGKVPFGPVQDAADIFADPHMAARDMLPRLDHPGCADPHAVPGIPVKLTRTPGTIRHRAPVLGEHTDSILHDAGCSADAIATLRASGVLG